MPLTEIGCMLFWEVFVPEVFVPEVFVPEVFVPEVFVPEVFMSSMLAAVNSRGRS